MLTKKPAQVSKKTTLDADYTKQCKSFTTKYRQLPTKKKTLKQLQSQMEIYNKKNMSEMTTEEITKYHSTKNEITELEKEIINIENFSEETEFYLKNGELLNKYYENSDQSRVTQKRGRPSKGKKPEECSTPIVSMSSFLKGQNPTQNDQSSQTGGQKKADSKFGKIQSFQRADIHEEYLANTDPHHLPSIQYNNHDDFCSACGEFRELMATEAIKVCPSCGDEIVAVMESDKPSYKDPPHENMYFAYKRINHFKEQLSHFQAKETTKIPQEVYDIILVELKKEKKTNLASLTRARIRRYLQKYSYLSYNKYYENINQIICHLNGMPPLSMPPEIEEQLCNMFQKIQDPFEKYCPLDRTNFLSYSYVIHKFCQLLGYNEYLPYFNLLKSKDKLHQQDKIWKKICQDLDWKYYPSSH